MRGTKDCRSLLDEQLPSSYTQIFMATRLIRVPELDPVIDGAVGRRRRMPKSV